ncbi:putative carnitine O-acetyltransferase mitochondrial precursor [Teratosphaeria nubilosa]|uniref:Carnitine O-acetyltransferase, mitochondrial n=1 Tax=Teratosphaeria nubilosa TaxID=161662 RepID=A0A6G1KWG5_9PEZI|nr:putative carnitine O-acetyltransferase mitochondrial precursor [Teratosphaeria nubilosa]
MMGVTHEDMFRNGTTTNGMKGKLFAQQESLPRLPVPPVEQTLTKWLHSTVPHQPSEGAYKATEKAVQSALNGPDAQMVQTLQKRLQDRAASKKSWLSEWWNEAAYMGYRDPIIPYVNYFYKHADDRKRRNNVTRASALLKGMLVFRQMVESDQLAPEATKAGPLCSSSYPYLFNSTRIPRTQCDYAVKYDAVKNNHLVVLRNGKYWEFELVKPDGSELSEKEIQTQLKRILEDPEASTPDPFPVGALTGDNRDQWARARDALIHLSPQNKQSLERIQSSVIVLCLDNESPVTMEEGSWLTWEGKGATNRFFDKQELVVFDNGSSGYNGEHSTMDGTPTLRMNDFVLAAVEADKVDMGASNSTDMPAPKRLEFQLNDSVKQSITSARRDFEALIGKHNMQVLDFQGYGSNAIKKFKCSPDGWVQMCLQLAHYKLHGKPCPTYESAQTRKYLLGRTEVIRSASAQSKAFCEAMQDASVSDEDAHKLFQTAVQQHLSYGAAAANAQGVDRHLFGLKKLLEPSEPVPAIFNDPMFATTSNWLLSTSQISSERFACWGFGEVTDGGYGCAYTIKAESLAITLVSCNEDTKRFRHYINEALVELKNLHLRLAAKAGAKAKL